jgi:hypothetical protein
MTTRIHRREALDQLWTSATDEAEASVAGSCALIADSGRACRGRCVSASTRG